MNNNQLSDALEDISKGMDEPCQLTVPPDPPPWLDKELFMIGRAFATQNLVPIFMGNFRSLLVGMSLPNLWEILTLTGRTNTEKKAARRYYMTGKHIHQFYTHLPWTGEGQKVFQTVNHYHLQAAMSQRLMSKAERSAKAKEVLTNLPPEDKIPPHPLDQVLFENLDLLKETRFKGRKFHLYEKYVANPIAFSQMDMALVQAAFIGSVVVFPSHFGAGGATALDLEGYLHLWRVVGYYLGVKDSCNLAKLPSLEESRKLFLEVGEELIVPSMLNYSPESLHMAKVTCGKFFDFHLSLYCHCYVHGYELKMLWQHFTLKQKLNYYLRNFIYEFLLKIPPIKRYVNNRLNAILQLDLSRYFQAS